jgi:hypothetical protein
VAQIKQSNISGIFVLILSTIASHTASFFSEQYRSKIYGEKDKLMKPKLHYNNEQLFKTKIKKKVNIEIGLFILWQVDET